MVTVTQTHEVAKRIVTLLGTTGSDAYQAAAIRIMDYTNTTKRDLVQRRSIIVGAIIASVRPALPNTIIASGRDLAHRIGGGRDGEKKDDQEQAVKPLVAAEYQEAALAAWAALLQAQAAETT